MWTIVYMAHSKADFDKVKKLLTNEGFLVKTKAIGKDNKVYEIMVLHSEVEEAHEVIVNIC